MSTHTPTPSPFPCLAARLSDRMGLRRPTGGYAAASVALLRPFLRLLPALAFVFAVAFAASADAAPKYEANFSKFAKTNGYFAIKGYSFDTTPPSTGKSRSRGSTQFSALTIERAVDFRSAEMLAHHTRGEIIPKVIVRFGEGTNIVFTMELKRVTIGGVSHTVSSPKKNPTELVTLNFEEIKWTARTPDGKTIQGNWKTSSGK